MGDVTLKMPWGAFKGKTVEEVPSSYLHWWAENGQEGSDKLTALMLAVNTELEFRDTQGNHF